MEIRALARHCHDGKSFGCRKDAATRLNVRATLIENLENLQAEPISNSGHKTTGWNG